jgi:hypothetical protein
MIYLKLLRQITAGLLMKDSDAGKETRKIKIKIAAAFNHPLNPF